MTRWLVVAAVLALGMPGAAHAQMKGLAPGEVAGVAHTRALDFRLSQELGAETAPPLMRTIVLRHQLSSRAAIGIGLSNLYGKRKAAGEFQAGPGRSRKPAVTFSIKF